MDQNNQNPPEENIQTNSPIPASPPVPDDLPPHEPSNPGTPQPPVIQEPVKDPQPSIPLTQSPEPVTSAPHDSHTSKGIMIGAIVIVLFVISGVGIYLYMMTANMKKEVAQQTQQQVQTSSAPVPPSPTVDPSTQLPLQDQASGVDVGNVTTDLQGIEKDLEQL